MRALAFILFLIPLCLHAQAKKDSLSFMEPIQIVETINPLAPAKAAFYSAILPGLGQAYNKKYWKIPLVYAGLGAGVYFYQLNHREYRSFRDAFKRRLDGFEDDKYQGLFADQTLIQAQRLYQRNRNISTLVIVGMYVLNIIDANVDAHLLQFNVSENLSFHPDYTPLDRFGRHQVGLTMQLKFN